MFASQSRLCRDRANCCVVSVSEQLQLPLPADQFGQREGKGGRIFPNQVSSVTFLSKHENVMILIVT